jgi:hypothetical protein
MNRTSRRLLFGSVSLVASVALLGSANLALGASAVAAAPSSLPAATCSSQSYAYAGLFSNLSASGIKATVTTLAAAQVTNGHVAGWIGVGGTSAGPGGVAEWLQTGVQESAGGDTEIYAETTRPGGSPTYQMLVGDVQPGTPYQLEVVELAGQTRNMWQVLLDGKPASTPVSLPGSSHFEPMAMSESWNGGTPTCNGFDYRFGNVKIATNPGAWVALTNTQSLTDNGYHITDRTLSGFTATSA